MDKIEITEKNLYIKEISQVIRSELTFRNKASFVTDRFSDCLIYVRSGSCRYTFDDGMCFEVRAGDILYLAYHASYRMNVGEENYSVVYCNFFFDSDELRKSRVYKVGMHSNAEILFRQLYKSYLSNKEQSFAECMAALYGIYSETINAAHGEYIGVDARSKVLQAKNRIDSEYMNVELSIEGLANECGVSQVYFRKIFRNIYRMAPTEYITAVRLKNAERIMLHTPLTLDECALRCGFSSVSYFCRVFKARYGISPARYRKENSVTSDSII